MLEPVVSIMVISSGAENSKSMNGWGSLSLVHQVCTVLYTFVAGVMERTDEEAWVKSRGAKVRLFVRSASSPSQPG